MLGYLLLTIFSIIHHLPRPPMFHNYSLQHRHYQSLAVHQDFSKFQNTTLIPSIIDIKLGILHGNGFKFCRFWYKRKIPSFSLIFSNAGCESLTGSGPSCRDSTFERKTKFDLWRTIGDYYHTLRKMRSQIHQFE